MGRARGTTGLAAAGRQNASGQRRGPYKWTPERIEAELLAFLGERQNWPTSVEFRAAGRVDLVDAVTRHGGVGHWARRLGVRISSRQLFREPYSPEDALREAREVIADRGLLPGPDALRAMGRGRLSTVVQRAGGAAAFCQKVGLPPGSARRRPRPRA